jgi:hypothetical protein
MEENKNEQVNALVMLYLHTNRHTKKKRKISVILYECFTLLFRR